MGIKQLGLVALTCDLCGHGEDRYPSRGAAIDAGWTEVTGRKGISNWVCPNCCIIIYRTVYLKFSETS